VPDVRPASASLGPAAIAAFTAGILAICALPQIPSAVWLALVTLPALPPWRARPFWAMAALGALLASWQGGHYLDQRWPADRHNEEVELQGTVVSLPELSTDVQGSPTWRFLFRPERSDLPPLVRVAWYRSPEQIRGGECWRFTLRLRTPHGSLNPGAFDYEAWLFRQGVAATATVKQGERCETARGAWLVGLRQALTDRTQAWLPQHAAVGLILALTTGDRSGLSDHDWDVFRVTGTSHLVAISGFNVAIIAGSAFFLIRWLWAVSATLCLWLPAQRAALVGSALLAGAYAALAGFEPPVERAWLMLAVVLIAAWAHRLVSPLRVLALAWLAILLADPFAVLSPGLWLSFGAVAVIMFVTTGRLRAAGLLRSLVHLQIVLSLAMVPLTLYFFQGASWLAPLVNLLAVPIVAVLTPLLLVALGLAAVAPPLGLPLLVGCADILLKLRAGLEWAATQLPAVWIPAGPPLAALLLALFGVILLIAPRGLPLRALGVLCLVALFVPRQLAPESGIELTALDVGQGLAVVVQTPQHTLLFDAGPAFEDGFDAGESVVVPFLLGRGIRKLDLLMLSHGDNDHAGGVPAVRKLLHVAREIGTRTGEPCREGLSWAWDGVRFEVLHPDAGSWSDNDSSCVLKIEGSFSILLPGDIEAAAERRLLAVHGARLQSDVVLAPHHGSKTSSTSEFVQTVKPQIVIYSAGWKNHFRHPRPEVVERYEEIGARQFVTGNLGALTVEPSLNVREWRRVAARFWNAPAENLRPVAGTTLSP
jgi:competence protein ComEC